MRYHFNVRRYDDQLVNLDDACYDDDCSLHHVHVLADDEYNDLVNRAAAHDKYLSYFLDSAAAHHITTA